MIKGHERVALSFSGGKDSLACVYLLRDHLEHITLYHLDTGDLLPETKEIVAHVRAFAPRFVHIQGDVSGWITSNGLPTDLLPYSAHPIGQELAQGPRLVTRYHCCYHNLMLPLFQRVVADGNTLLIRGTKAEDVPRLPVADGDRADGVEFWYPIQDWTNARVMAYLRGVGAPISPVYAHSENSPECMRCPAWWSEHRASYLKQHHPGAWRDYGVRLRAVAEAVMPALAHLEHEVKEFDMFNALEDAA